MTIKCKIVSQMAQKMRIWRKNSVISLKLEFRYPFLAMLIS